MTPGFAGPHAVPGLARPHAVPGFARLPVLATAGVTGAVLLSLNGRYGYHRDELYFRLLGKHLSWGYVDQGPLTPLAARASTLLGDTVWALRLPATLATVALVVLAALLARELDGGAVAQTLAAFGAAAAAFPLIVGHALLTASFDAPLWVLVVWCAVRALRHDSRWWLAAGAAAGAALYNKYLVVLLGAGLLAGLLVAGPRAALADRWLWAGAGLALLVGVPNLVYQATHGWPQFPMAAALNATDGAENRVTFVPLQFLLLGPAHVPVWLAGWWGLWRDERWRPVRALAVAYPAAAAVALLTGGRPDYVFGLLLTLFAAGCVRAEAWRPAVRRVLVAALVIDAAVSALVALPLVPERRLAATPVPDINEVAREQVGWPEFVAAVARVHDTLPAADRPVAVLLTGNYGEAGALDRFGPRYGLPAIYSGHNELWYRARPPESATVAVTVGLGLQYARARFERCDEAGTVDTGVIGEERGEPILVCRMPAGGWATVWPRFQHFS